MQLFAKEKKKRNEYISTCAQAMMALARPPAGLAGRQLRTLLTQGNVGPEPTQHLDKDEGEENTVLQRIAAPAGRATTIGCGGGANATVRRGDARVRKGAAWVGR